MNTSLKPLLLCVTLFAIAPQKSTAGQWNRYNPGTSAGLAAITWDGSKFIAVGGGGTIITSPDGANWSQQTTVVPSILTGVANDGHGHYVAVGEGAALKSSDGYAWELLPPKPRYSLLESVTWGRGKFVSVGGVGIALASTSGGVWSRAKTHNYNFFLSVAYSPTKRRYAAVSIQGTSMISNTGLSWTPRHAYNSTLRGIVWAGNKFVAVGSQGTALTSAAGGSWTYHYMGAQYDFEDVAWSGGSLLAVGWSYFGYGIYASSDGISWTEVHSYSSGIPYAVCWGGGRFVVVGESGFVGVYTP